MTACPACRGTGRAYVQRRRLTLAVGRLVNGRQVVRLTQVPPCPGCKGTGQLVVVLLQ